MAWRSGSPRHDFKNLYSEDSLSNGFLTNAKTEIFLEVVMTHQCTYLFGG